MLCRKDREPIDISDDRQAIYTDASIRETMPMNSFVAAHSAIAAEPPDIPLQEIASAVQLQYGMDGEFLQLISERDQNFHLRTAGGAGYVVKVVSSAEPAIVSAFQLAALLHLENLESPQVPRVIRTRNGGASGSVVHAGKVYLLRIVSYLDGVPMADAGIDQYLARDFGAALARLGVALQGLSHRGERPALLWDLQRTDELMPLLAHIDDPAIRRSVATVLGDFETSVKPKLGNLRCQVIHGDANPGNVLVEPNRRRVTGLIDFGDMIRAPLICDVAIAAAYLRSGGDDPLEMIAPFVAAYDAVRPLEGPETALLFDLVRARLATTITILYWRINARRDDDRYRQKTLEEEADAISFLDALNDLGRAGFSRRLARDASR
jgi:Ser/Thr protein kinase RdoA (MazF antagonist)